MSQTITWFAFLGLIGGFTHAFMDSKNWRELIEYESIKQTIVGAISGGLYWFLYTNHNFPNFIMAFVVGYSGTDFISKIVKKYIEHALEEEKRDEI